MKRISWLMMAATLGSCLDNSGEMLQLTQAMVPVPPQCTVNAADQIFRSFGTRDVTANSLANYGYYFRGRLVNNAQSVDEYPVRYLNNDNVYVEANDVTIDGYNVCYEFLDYRDASTQVAQIDPSPSLHAPSCRELGGGALGRTLFLPAAGTDVVPEQASIASVDLFPPAVTAVDVQFPTPPSPMSDDEVTFDRMAGVIPMGVSDDQWRAQNFATAVAAYDAAVEAAYQQAANNPFVRGLDTPGATRRVLVHIQAVGRTRYQRRIESNEFLYPVDLCRGCLTITCAIDPASLCTYGQDTSGTCLQQ